MHIGAGGMKFITTSKLGYEVEFQETLEVIGWQITKECLTIIESCSKFSICIQPYLHSWGIRIF